MSLFNSIYEQMFGIPQLREANARASDAETASAAKRLAFQGLLDQRGAQSALTGGTDPNTGITWNTGRQPIDPSTYQAPDDSGNYQRFNLLGDKQSPAMTPDTMNLLRNSPKDFAQNQQDLMAQADPDAAMKARVDMNTRQSRLAAIDALPGLPDNVRESMRVESFGDSNTAKALADNLKSPDAIKEVHTLIADLGRAAPGSDEYKTTAALLQQKTQNMPLMQLHETMRHNLADEGNSAIVMTTDAAGMPAYFDKRTKQTMSILPDPFAPNAPGGAQPAPSGVVARDGTIPTGAMQPVGATAADKPVYDATAATDRSPERRPWLTAPPAATAPQQGTPRMVYSDEYIHALPAQSQAAFAALPPAIQFQLGPILSGKASPPESGRAQTDPQLKNILRMAAMVDPNFNEQTWRQRNKMATEYVDMSNGKLGGMQASSQKVLNHLTDAIGAGADMGNDSWLGTPGNFVDNALVRQAPPGAPGNSPAKKSALTSAQGFKKGVGEEFEKFMAGAPGAEKSKEEAQRLLDEDQDISGLIGGAGAIAEMMKGQAEPQLAKYNEAMGAHKTLRDWLGPESTAKYDFIQQLAADVKAGKNVDATEVKRRLAALRAGAADNPGITPVQTIVDELRRRGAIK